jgi:hypothetical protein
VARIFTATTRTDARRGKLLKAAFRAGACACASLACGATPAFAASNVKITALSDVAFATIANLSADSVRAQSICVYSNSPTNGYRVTASGTAGGPFTLTSGGNSLAYEVQWSASTGQTSGTQLVANVATGGFISTATQNSCNNGPATTASLIVILRAAALSSAMAGTYNGTLTLVVGPE